MSSGSTLRVHQGSVRLGCFGHSRVPQTVPWGVFLTQFAFSPQDPILASIRPGVWVVKTNTNTVIYTTNLRGQPVDPALGEVALVMHVISVQHPAHTAPSARTSRSEG